MSPPRAAGERVEAVGSSPLRDADWDVVGVGANSVDRVLVLSGPLPALTTSAKLDVRSESRHCGGQTATTLATCAAFGLRAKYIGPVGADPDGALVREALGNRGVDVDDVMEVRGATQTATILVHPESGSRLVLSCADGRVALAGHELPLACLSRARLLHVDDVHLAAAQQAAEEARAQDLPVTSDIDRAEDGAAALMEAVTCPILAEDVPTRLAGLSDLGQALSCLRRAHTDVLCVTLGERGCLALARDAVDTLLRQSAYPVRVVDTTGAGDVFRGGFIYGRLQGWPLPQILRFAAAAAALSCTRLGAIDSVPTLEAVDRLVRNDLGAPFPRQDDRSCGLPSLS